MVPSVHRSLSSCLQYLVCFLRQRTGLLLLPLALSPLPIQAAPASLSMEQAVQEALGANLSLAARRYDIDIARAEIITARLRPNPEIGTEFAQLEPGGPYSDESEYALGVEFTIEGPGKRRSRIREAQRATSVVEFEFEDFVRELILETQEAALEIKLVEANLTLARNNLEAAESIVELTEALYSAGEIDGIELRRARLLLPQSRNELRSLEVELEAALREFNRLLGNSDNRFTVRGDFRATGAIPMLDEALEQALELRPDMRAVLAERERAAADLTLQYAERRPDVTVGTEVRRFRGNGSYLGLSVSVPLPLFDRNQGEISRAQYAQLQADTELLALRAEIQNTLRSAHTRLSLNLDLLESVTLELDEARQLYAITDTSYRSGAASLLEVLDARTAVNEAEAAYNEIRADIARDLYKFDYLTATSVTP